MLWYANIPSLCKQKMLVKDFLYAKLECFMMDIIKGASVQKNLRLRWKVNAK